MSKHLPVQPSLLGLEPKALQKLIQEKAEAESSGVKIEPFRAKQIAHWIYQDKVLDFDAMTNLSLDLRAFLKEHFSLRQAQPLEVQKDAETTTKVALRFPDGSIIESVLMFEENANGSERRTLCISTQAGCAMGCHFCASGQKGLKRHLSTSEILEQFYAFPEILEEGKWLTNVVYMGMGEPLHNWDAFLRSLRVLTESWGFGMSSRRITVSSVGFPQRIRELARMGLHINLALSLHAANDTLREKLIPTNALYGGVHEIVGAAREYQETSGRQVTWEYTLVKGVNDHTSDAYELAGLMREQGQGTNINLIPMNPVTGSGLAAPDARAVERFSQILRSLGLSVHTRKKKGRSISAACGQLRLQLENSGNKA